MVTVLLVICLIVLCLNVGFDVYRFIVKPYEADDLDRDRLFQAMLLLDIDGAFRILDASEVEHVDVDELHRSSQAVLMYVFEGERFVPDTYPEAVATEMIHRILLDLLLTVDVKLAKAVNG
jgi:hypothetical protein